MNSGPALYSLASLEGNYILGVDRITAETRTRESRNVADSIIQTPTCKAESRGQWRQNTAANTGLFNQTIFAEWTTHP